MKKLPIRGYYITQDGKIFSDRSGLMYELTQSLDKNGYKTVRLDKKTCYVHKLVIQTFKPKMEVNHIDGDRSNNHIDNLEWVTHRENIYHAMWLGLTKKNRTRGIQHRSCKLTEKEVLSIRTENDTYKKLSIKYNVVPSTISKIKNNQIWTHI